MLPLRYTLRNLVREPAKLVQKIAGSVAVLLLVMVAASFNAGMRELLLGSGSTDNVVLLGIGSEESLERSQIGLQTENVVAASLRGIRVRAGVAAVSGEVHHMAMVEVPGHGSGQLSLRGVTLAALEVHRQVRLIDGGWARSGEVMAGVMAHHALGLKQPFAVDDTVVIEDQELRVAGLFDAAGTVAESEIWLNRSDLNTLVQRETLSSVVVKLEDPDAFASVDLFAKRRLDLELSALPERRYYGNVEAFYRPVRGMVWLTAVLIAIGAVMGGLNMLYAAYSARIRELATLQTLGFSRPALLWTLIQESLLTQLLGLACAVLLMRVLLEGHVVRFSLGAFQLETGQGTLWAGISTALLLGTIGTLPPALRCLRMPLPAALRAS